MLDKQKTKPSFIGLAGNIGVGKTTFTKLLSEKLNWTPFFESVSDNPYLSDFYSDMKRWSFNLQIFFLHKRFEMHQKMSASLTSVIQDRTIYEDCHIFAKNLWESDILSERDFQNYHGIYQSIISNVPAPDLLIYLEAELPQLQRQIQKRGRDYEAEIPASYLRSLNSLYKDWIANYTLSPVLTLTMSELDFVAKEEDFAGIVGKVEEALQVEAKA